MSGETDLAKLIATMEPVLASERYIFATLENWDYTRLAQLTPLSTFQENEGLTAVLTQAKADEFGIVYAGVLSVLL
ncbi:ACT domain-containing protein [Pseudoalteromonas sp. MSK9-3]|uniref:ACT domain-containing protein n=1 Tax=Pseudoalteromonas sp. MSK9-3 TaxID=1897633 RepID=UPI0026B6A049